MASGRAPSDATKLRGATRLGRVLKIDGGVFASQHAPPPLPRVGCIPLIIWYGMQLVFQLSFLLGRVMLSVNMLIAPRLQSVDPPALWRWWNKSRAGLE